MNPYNYFFQHPVCTGNEVLKLIPQRSPIIEVDKFFGIDDQNSFSGLTVKEEDLFCHQGVFSEEGMIEHFAQSAAARIGYLFVRKGEPVPLGFIGAVSKFTLYSNPRKGDELLTVVSIIQEVGNITLASVKSWVNDVMVADGELKIYLNKE